MQNKIENIYKKIDNLMNKNKVSAYLWQFGNLLLKRIQNSHFGYSSSFLAYSLILSFIPMIIFISQMLSHVNENFDQILFNAINYLPDSTAEILTPLLEGLISVRSSSLSTVALVSWLWLGSRGFLGLTQTINEIFDVNKKQNFIVEKISGVIYMIGFIIIFAALLIFNVFNKHIINFIEQYLPINDIAPGLFDLFVNGLTSLMPLFMMIVMFALFYKFAPATDATTRIPFKAAFIGSSFTSIAIVLITLIYSYSQNLSNNNLYYGSMAGILALLVWLLMICQVIVLGAEIIATYLEMKKLRDINTDPLTTDAEKLII